MVLGHVAPELQRLGLRIRLARTRCVDRVPRVEVRDLDEVERAALDMAERGRAAGRSAGRDRVERLTKLVPVTIGRPVNANDIYSAGIAAEGLLRLGPRRTGKERVGVPLRIGANLRVLALDVGRDSRADRGCSLTERRQDEQIPVVSLTVPQNDRLLFAGIGQLDEWGDADVGAVMTRAFARPTIEGSV